MEEGRQVWRSKVWMALNVRRILTLMRFFSPVKLLKNGWDVVDGGGLGDDAGSWILEQSQLIEGFVRETKEEGVELVTKLTKMNKDGMARYRRQDGVNVIDIVWVQIESGSQGVRESESERNSWFWIVWIWCSQEEPQFCHSLKWERLKKTDFRSF